MTAASAAALESNVGLLMSIGVSLLQSGKVLGDRSALFVAETPGHGAHDVCSIVAARAALELRQLLDDVRLTLAGRRG